MAARRFDEMQFKDRIAVVTGATSGIGRATALRLLSEGATVAAVARRKDVLQEISASTTAGKLLPFPADLCEREQRQDLARRLRERFGGIDVLINAAGMIGSGSIETTSWEEWDRMININLDSVFELTRLLLPAISERKGNIVNVSSVAGTRSFPNLLAYSVSKAALDQFTRCTALELASRGVRVNAVNPGVVVTQLHRAGGMNEEQYQAFLERSKTTHPIGRVGSADEIADLILFLASERAGWITGVTLPIDGGRHLTCAR
jgi:NAD(P)-dependent dehydrogenase (short-subunit alcohol dehydrogenase family)